MSPWTEPGAREHEPSPRQTTYTLPTYPWRPACLYHSLPVPGCPCHYLPIPDSRGALHLDALHLDGESRRGVPATSAGDPSRTARTWRTAPPSHPAPQPSRTQPSPPGPSTLHPPRPRPRPEPRQLSPPPPAPRSDQETRRIAQDRREPYHHTTQAGISLRIGSQPRINAHRRKPPDSHQAEDNAQPQKRPDELDAPRPPQRPPADAEEPPPGWRRPAEIASQPDFTARTQAISVTRANCVKSAYSLDVGNLHLFFTSPIDKWKEADYST